MKTQMIIVAAPSGAGKSSFLDRALKDFSILEDTITFTTREMRKGEGPGNPYHFVSIPEFEALVAKNYFVEWAQVHGNFYGTPLEQIEKAFAAGRVIIMDVDIQGADTFKAKYPQAKSIFILPPSIEELRRRVINREGREPSNMALRMQNAEREMARAGEFDFRLVNDEFESSYRQFKKIIEDLVQAR